MWCFHSSCLKHTGLGSSNWITRNKKIGKWDVERMQVSCTLHFKGSNRYFDVSKKELSNKAWVIYTDAHCIWTELTKKRVTKNTRALTIILHGKPGNFGWKIKWFTPSCLGRLQKNGLCLDAMQFLNSFLVCSADLDILCGESFNLPPSQILYFYVYAQKFHPGWFV